MLDRTFLRLSEDEEVSANFAFNEDMTKDMNGRKANIYTLTADNVAAAGNTMPLNDQTLIVPLNVVTWTADNFTISIPEGTSGIGVTLVDEETGERTNLALGDYSRYLEKGTYSNRFHLEIAPIKQVPTGLEPTSDSSLEAMTRIGETDTWYYDYGGASITPTLYVSFTSESQNGSENFWHKSPDVNVVYPANYPDAIHTNKSAENGFKAATPMFVPLESQAAIPLSYNIYF